MVPRGVSGSAAPFLFIATCLLLVSAASAVGQTFITIVVPFGSAGVPLSGDPAPRSQAGFKTCLLKAFVNTLNNLASKSTCGSGSLAPAVPLPASWAFSTATSPQTATVTFAYTDAWSAAISFLSAYPWLLYSNSQVAGVNLVNQYGTISGAATITPTGAVASLSPPSPLSLPPSPWPPLNPLGAASPPAAAGAGVFVLTTTITSAALPTDAASRAALQATYLSAFTASLNQQSAAITASVGVPTFTLPPTPTAAFWDYFHVFYLNPAAAPPSSSAPRPYPVLCANRAYASLTWVSDSDASLGVLSIVHEIAHAAILKAVTSSLSGILHSNTTVVQGVTAAANGGRRRMMEDQSPDLSSSSSSSSTPQAGPITRFLAALAKAEASAGQTVLVTIVVPFGAAGIPLPGDPIRMQAGFKTCLLSAFVNTLNYIAATPASGSHPSSPAPATSAPRSWAFTTATIPQTATVTFAYPAAWQAAVSYLSTHPSLIYTNSQQPGANLQGQYGAILGVTIAVPTAPMASPSPPPPLPTASPTPPTAAPSTDPYAPIQLQLNSTYGVFVLNAWLYSDSYSNDISQVAALQGNYFSAFAVALNNVTARVAAAAGVPNAPIPPTADIAQCVRADLTFVLCRGIYLHLTELSALVYYLVSYSVLRQTQAALSAALPTPAVMVTQIVQSTLSSELQYNVVVQVAGRRRRLVEGHSLPEALSSPTTSVLSWGEDPIAALLPAGWADVEPSESASDPLGNRFEVFTTPSDYHTAAQVCLARGAELAGGAAVDDRALVEALCEGASDQVCWGADGAASKCTSALLSKLHPGTLCAQRRPFVCVKLVGRGAVNKKNIARKLAE